MTRIELIGNIGYGNIGIEIINGCTGIIKAGNIATGINKMVACVKRENEEGHVRRGILNMYKFATPDVNILLNCPHWLLQIRVGPPFFTLLEQFKSIWRVIGKRGNFTALLGVGHQKA